MSSGGGEGGSERYPTACHAAKNPAPRRRQACPRRGAWTSTGPRPSASLHPQKALHRGDGAGGVLLFRRVAEILEDHQRATGNFAVKALGIGGRDQPVASAPEDQRRQLQLRDPP